MIDRRPRHVLEDRRRCKRGAFSRASRTLGDVAREIAHPLQIGGDHLDSEYLSEVAGHRRIEGERFQDRAVDRDIESIDFEIVGDDLLGQFPISIFECPEGLFDDRLGPASHLKQHVSEIANYGVE